MTKTQKGVLGTKLGMTQVWDANNRVVPVTVIQAGPCVVTQVRTPENDGYSAIQIAYGAIEPRKVNKPDAGHFYDITTRAQLSSLYDYPSGRTRGDKGSRPDFQLEWISIFF